MPRRKIDYSPLPGFPKREPFRSLAEIDLYLSGNLIQCLECGHWFKGLARHITSAHNIDADEYKATHGIPWGRGLLSGGLHQSLSEKAKNDGIVSKIKNTPSPEARKGPHRPYCPARKEAKKIYTDQQYWTLAKRVAAGEAFLTVSKEPDMPSTDGVRHYRGRNKKFDRFWRDVVEPRMLRSVTSSYREKISSGEMARFWELVDAGESAKAIAETLSWKIPTVRYHLKKLRTDKERTERESDI